jgi:hypothetical protein
MECPREGHGATFNADCRVCQRLRGYTAALTRQAPTPASSPPLASAAAPDCIHLGNEIEGAERQARGLSHLRVWRTCALGLGNAGAVCKCLGCGPQCGQYQRPLPEAGNLASEAGVVIGTYGWPRLVETQILTIHETCGPSTPILLADDGSPATADLARLAERYGVDFAGELRRRGHYAGDLSVFRKGIEWGQRLGLAVVVKLSMRMLITHPGWLADVAHQVLTGPAETVLPALTEGMERWLYFRTEAVAMRVREWAGMLPRLADDRLDGPTELRLNDIIVRDFGGRCLNWEMFPRDRYARGDGFIWHCSHTPAEYAAHFARFGLQLDQDFYTDGHQNQPNWKAG